MQWKIEIIKSGNEFRANLTNLPGSPFVGIGLSKEMAVAQLFMWLARSEPMTLAKIASDRTLEIIEK
jgi:hypothetical protein